MPDAPTIFEKEASRGFDNSNRNEATIQELLNVNKQLGEYLDRYLYSSISTEETIIEDVEEEDPITQEIKKVKKPTKLIRYKHLPTEERIVGCRTFGLSCDERNFMPDTMQSYSSALDPEMFGGYCIVYTHDPKEGKHMAKLERLQEHIKEKHGLTIEFDDLIYNSRWLTWDPMFRNIQGFDSVKSYIMLNVAPINSTTIIPDKKNRFGVDTDELINNQAVDMAQLNLQNIILKHREYGFNMSPTTIREILNLEANLFRAALQRNLNGIFLRGIIQTIESREVNIRQENVGSKAEQGGGVFGKIINRGN